MKTLKVIFSLLISLLFIQCGGNDETPLNADEQQANISVLAGNGNKGDVSGAGNVAEFNQLGDICIDSKGNLFVIDRGNFKIKKITTNGETSTFAGSTEGSVTEDKDGTGASAKFMKLRSIAIDSKDNLYVIDEGYNKDTGPVSTIRKITPQKVVSTLYSNVSSSNKMPIDMVVDTNDNLLVLLGRKIIKMAPNTDSFVDFMEFNAEYTGLNQFMVIDSQNNIYVNIFKVTTAIIKKITPDKNVTTFIEKNPSLLASVTATAIDKNNNIYYSNVFYVAKVTPESNVSLFIGENAVNINPIKFPTEEFSAIIGTVFDKQGNLYIADRVRNQILKISF